VLKEDAAILRMLAVLDAGTAEGGER